MEKLVQTTGRIFYGLAITGTGFLHFIYPGIRPVLAPIAPEVTAPYTLLIYINAVIIIVAGIAIVANRYVKTAALSIGTLFLLFLIIGHLPNRLTNYVTVPGAWTDALKLLALAGGAFVISGLYHSNSRHKAVLGLEKIAPTGKYFFALMLIIFGIDHFLYVDFVKTLVPTWIPGNVFWTYFCGLALLGAGLSIFINFKPRLTSILLATMLFTWLIVVHIPFSISFSYKDSGNNLTSAFQDLAFCGIALLYPYVKRKETATLPAATGLNPAGSSA